MTCYNLDHIINTYYKDIETEVLFFFMKLFRQRIRQLQHRVPRRKSACKLVERWVINESNETKQLVEIILIYTITYY